MISYINIYNYIYISIYCCHFLLKTDNINVKQCLFRSIDYSTCCRSLQIDWMPPRKPNGIILGYDLLWKTWYPCPKTQKLVQDQSDELCKAVRCQKPEYICGHICYSPEAKVSLFKLISEPCFSHSRLHVKLLASHTMVYYDQYFHYSMKKTPRKRKDAYKNCYHPHEHF